MYNVRSDLEPLMQRAIALSGQGVEPSGRLYGSYHLEGFTNADAFRNTLERFNQFRVPERLDGLRVADLGSNTGALSFEAARRGARVLGVECNPERVQICRAIAAALNLPCYFAQADLDEWHMMGSADIVFCCSIDHYVADPDRLYKMLPQVCRLCYFESNRDSQYEQLRAKILPLWKHAACLSATRTERQVYVLWNDNPPFPMPAYPENRLWEEAPEPPAPRGFGYAFDVQGTLISADRTRPRLEIVALTRALAAAGERVYLISSCSESHRGQIQDLEFVRDLATKWEIPNHGVYLAYFEATPEEGHVYRAGQSKAELMRRLGASVLFDDLADICQAVRDAGLTAIQV